MSMYLFYNGKSKIFPTKKYVGSNSSAGVGEGSAKEGASVLEGQGEISWERRKGTLACLLWVDPFTPLPVTPEPALYSLPTRHL